MTEKELLYIEDAANHQKHLETKCEDFTSQLQDKELKAFATSLKNKNKEFFDELLKLLN